MQMKIKSVVSNHNIERSFRRNSQSMTEFWGMFLPRRHWCARDVVRGQEDPTGPHCVLRCWACADTPETFLYLFQHDCLCLFSSAIDRLTMVRFWSQYGKENCEGGRKGQYSISFLPVSHLSKTIQTHTHTQNKNFSLKRGCEKMTVLCG